MAAKDPPSNLASILLIKRKMAERNNQDDESRQLPSQSLPPAGAYSEEKITYYPEPLKDDATNTKAASNDASKASRKAKQLEVGKLDKKFEEIDRKQETTKNETLDSWKGFDSLNYAFAPGTDKKEPKPLTPAPTKQGTPSPQSRLRQAPSKRVESPVTDQPKPASQTHRADSPPQSQSKSTPKPDRIRSPAQDQPKPTSQIHRADSPSQSRSKLTAKPDRIHSPALDQPKLTSQIHRTDSPLQSQPKSTTGPDRIHSPTQDQPKPTSQTHRPDSPLQSQSKSTAGPDRILSPTRDQPKATSQTHRADSPLQSRPKSAKEPDRIHSPTQDQPKRTSQTHRADSPLQNQPQSTTVPDRIHSPTQDQPKPTSQTHRTDSPVRNQTKGPERPDRMHSPTQDQPKSTSQANRVDSATQDKPQSIIQPNRIRSPTADHPKSLTRINHLDHPLEDRRRYEAPSRKEEPRKETPPIPAPRRFKSNSGPSKESAKHFEQEQRKSARSASPFSVVTSITPLSADKTGSPFEPSSLSKSLNQPFKLFPDIKHPAVKRSKNACQSIQRSMDRYRFHIW